MRTKKLGADGLIELAIEALRTEIVPGLAAEQRYTAAMIANALEIARRDVESETETAQWELLDPIYGEGDGTLRELADDIRAGVVNSEKQPDLRVRLRALLVAELKVRNPRFLISRSVKG
jgi:hypothetical protein